MMHRLVLIALLALAFLAAALPTGAPAGGLGKGVPVDPLTFAEVREIVQRAEPQAGIRSCQRLGRHYFHCRVAITLAWAIREDEDGRVVRKTPVRRLIWMGIGPAGSEWAYYRDELAPGPPAQ